jgi:ribonuclease P protein component
LPEDFRRCIRAGGRSGGPLVVVHLLVPTPGTPDSTAGAQPRVGFVVSRAVGKAVTRNLVKRRLRHLLRPRMARLPGGAVLVVRALPASGTASSAALGAELDRGLGRLLPQGTP